MLLPPPELVGFSYFESRHKSDYHNSYDVVTLHYRKKNFLGIERKYTNEIKIQREYTQKDENTRSWSQTAGYIELITQLHNIVEGTWTSVPTELYERIKIAAPEYML